MRVIAWALLGGASIFAPAPASAVDFVQYTITSNSIFLTPYQGPSNYMTKSYYVVIPASVVGLSGYASGQNNFTVQSNPTSLTINQSVSSNDTFSATINGNFAGGLPGSDFSFTSGTLGGTTELGGQRYGYSGLIASVSVQRFSSDNPVQIGVLSVSPVPEPATWAMMLIGFGIVGAVARRRKSVAKVTYA